MFTALNNDLIQILPGKIHLNPLTHSIMKSKNEENYMRERKKGRHAARAAAPRSNVNRQFTKQFAGNSWQFACFSAIQASTDAPEFESRGNSSG